MGASPKNEAEQEVEQPTSTQNAAQAQDFMIDNTMLFRNSRDLEDIHFDRCGAEWGSIVQGIEEGDGWLKVGEFYLPMVVQGVAVVTPVCSKVDAPGNAELVKEEVTQSSPVGEQAIQPDSTSEKVEVKESPKPDFGGDWKMVRYEGDFETWMKDAGVGWASRKAASAAGFGVNATFASIQQSEGQISIKSKSMKGTTLQELKINGCVQDDADLVSSKAIKVVPRWEEVSGVMTFTVEAPASMNKGDSVSTPLTRRYLDGGSMVVERTASSGTLIRLFFAKEG